MEPFLEPWPQLSMFEWRRDVKSRKVLVEFAIPPLKGKNFAHSEENTHTPKHTMQTEIFEQEVVFAQ